MKDPLWLPNVNTNVNAKCIHAFNVCVYGTVLKISAIQQFAGYLIYLITVAQLRLNSTGLWGWPYLGSSPNSVSCHLPYIDGGQ